MCIRDRIYLLKRASGGFEGLDTAQIEGELSELMGQPVLMTIFVVIVVVMCFGVVSLGLQKGVEGITKIMMVLLLALLIILAVRAVTLPGAGAGLEFYLLPDFGKMKEAGIMEVISAAMGQSFFTLSLGIGAMEIFGSYIDKKRALPGEAMCIRDRC